MPHRFLLIALALRRASLLLALTLLAPPVFAEVALPNGEWRTSAVDLEVAVPGGRVRVERRWQAESLTDGVWRWHLNPAWADLIFTYDSLDGSVASIRRAGAVFERGGDVYGFDDVAFIRKTDSGWRWFDRRGHGIDYDAAGKILSYGDRTGLTVTFVRDGQGRIVQLRDRLDTLILSYEYVGDQVGAIEDRAGRRVSYQWQGGHLVGVTDVRGHVWQYTYSQGAMTALTDPLQHTTQIAYSGHRVVRLTDAQGGQTNYSYDYDRGKRQFTIVEHSPGGVRRERRYALDGRLLHEIVGSRPTLRLIRDAEHIEHRLDERGQTTTTEYDADRRPIRVRHPDGTEAYTRYENSYALPIEHIDTAGIKTTSAYDAQGNLTQQIDAAGLPEQRLTQFSYDSHGQLLSRTVKGATPADDATTSFTYDAYGNVLTQTDPLGHTTTFTYNVQGQVLSRTDALARTTLYTYDAAGNLLTVTDPLGHVTSTVYDAVNRPVSTANALGQLTLYSYTANGWLQTITDPLGQVTSYTYDADGRRLSETAPGGAVTSYGYDSDGRLTSLTDPAGTVIAYQYGGPGLEGLLTEVVFPTYREQYRYDARDRRTQTIRLLPAHGTQPERQETTEYGYEARGLRISQTDPLGRSTLSRYDGLGRLVEVIDPLGGKTRYAYDPRDNLTAVTDATDSTHSFAYDNADRLIAETRPSGQSIAYTYDAAHQLTQRTAAGGERRQYSYDSAGRRTGEQHLPAGLDTASQTITYSYTAAGQLSAYQQSGDPVSSASYSYDANGRKTAESVQYGDTLSATLAYGYHPNGQLASLTYPDGTVVSYSYAQTRLSAIDTPEGTLSYTNYAWQQPQRIVLPGVVQTRTVDPLQRPLRLQSQALGAGTADSPQGPVVRDDRYSYDPAGNLTQRTTEDGTYTYTYDALDRLTQAAPPASLQLDPANPQPGQLPVEQYSYDGVHNRMSSAHQPGSWTYTGDHQLLAWGQGTDAVTLTYDANGHTLQQTRASVPPTLTQHIYDAGERLREVNVNGMPKARFAYDPFGRRIRKEMLGAVPATTWYLYSEQGLIAEYDGTVSAGSGAGANGTKRIPSPPGRGGRGEGPSPRPAGRGVRSEGKSTGGPQLIRTYGWKPDGLWGTDPVFLVDIQTSTDATTGAITTTRALHVYHNDHLGTPQRLTDATGTVTWAARSEAFGKTYVTTSTVNNPLRFPGQYFDPETNSYHNRFRDYDYTLGRYFQIDPLGITPSTNTYGDVPPILSSRAVWSPIPQTTEIGREEAIFRRTNHRVPA